MDPFTVPAVAWKASNEPRTSFSFLAQLSAAFGGVHELLREAAGVAKASSNPGKEVGGSVTAAQVAEIAKIKLPDLNANDLEAAKLQVEGTPRSMGITVN